MPDMGARNRAVLNSAVWAHNPEVAGSNPALATRKWQVRGPIAGYGGRALIFVAARRQQDRAASAGQEHKELAENGSEDGQTGIAARAWRRGQATILCVPYPAGRMSGWAERSAVH